MWGQGSSNQERAPEHPEDKTFLGTGLLSPKLCDKNLGRDPAPRAPSAEAAVTPSGAGAGAPPPPSSPHAWPSASGSTLALPGRVLPSSSVHLQVVR